MHPSALAALDRSSSCSMACALGICLLLCCFLCLECAPFPLTRWPPQLRLSSIACIPGNPVPPSMMTMCLWLCFSWTVSSERARTLCFVFALLLFCILAPNLARSSLLNKYYLTFHLILEGCSDNKYLFNKFVQHTRGSASCFHCFLLCEVRASWSYLDLVLF